MPTIMQERKNRFAFPILLPKEMVFAEIGDEVEMHIVPTGKWDHPAYGEMEITSKEIAQFVQNFKDKVRLDIPITAGHDNGMNGGELPAIAWFKELEDRGVSGLWGIVKFTEEGKQLLSDGSFKYFSPEFYEVYEDPQTRKTYNYVLVGGALTNKPYFKELKPVASFSEPTIINQFSDNNTMDLNTILAKQVADMTEEEKQFVRDNQETLTDEQKETVKDVLTVDESGDDSDGKGDGDGSSEEAGDDNGEGAGDEGDGEDAGNGEEDGAPVTASEKGKKGRFMSEAEIAALEAKANNGQQAFTELNKMKLEQRFSDLTVSRSNEAGRFLPKQKTAVVKFMEGLKPTQLDQFTEIVKNLPKVSLFTENGDGSAVATNTAKALETKVQEMIAASEGGKMKYSDALKKVLAAHPELQDYNEAEA